MVSKTTTTNEKYTITRLFKEPFYISFVKIYAIAGQKMLFLNFPHYRSMEKLSYQIEEII